MVVIVKKKVNHHLSPQYVSLVSGVILEVASIHKSIANIHRNDNAIQ